MIKAIRSTLSNIYTVLCSVVIVIGIVSLIAVLAGIRPFVLISESMHPEVTKNSLVMIDTHSKLDDVIVGDNVAYILGKVEAMHKASRVEPENLTVRSLADDGESVITADVYIGKQVFAIPSMGGWIRSVLNHKWLVIVVAAALIVIGCIPSGQKETERRVSGHKHQVQSTEPEPHVDNGESEFTGGLEERAKRRRSVVGR